MNERKVIGVSRGSEYSPNHIGNDAAIFGKVVDELEQLGLSVRTYTEKEFTEQAIEGSLIFNMARDRATINRLKQLEDSGAWVINSGYGIDNCVRRPMTELLLGGNIPHPASVIIDTASSTGKDIPFYPCWIKRGDSHAMVKEDVCYAICAEEADKVLTDFEQRGIPCAVVNEHVQGDLVKFYGVRGGGFFYWFYPSPCSHSKFGLEAINGEAKGIPFSEDELKTHCEKASCLLGIEVYGGDCVISPSGEMFIIDFNDWPSFARCREEAGVEIANYIYEQAKRK